MIVNFLKLETGKSMKGSSNFIQDSSLIWITNYL